ncbi:hypothetical protein L208DRAFT_669642 [Tricholoma matsutake]|nr:hypothetical protein L208DRAFT_669642 [Tricholoma matsutake 945]
MSLPLTYLTRNRGLRHMTWPGLLKVQHESSSRCSKVTGACTWCKVNRASTQCWRRLHAVPREVVESVATSSPLSIGLDLSKRTLNSILQHFPIGMTSRFFFTIPKKKTPLASILKILQRVAMARTSECSRASAAPSRVPVYSGTPLSSLMAFSRSACTVQARAGYDDSVSVTRIT